MANIIKDFIQRIKIDYQEWRMYQRTVWDVKRDNKAIRRAIARAEEKNYSDNKTYYIVKDRLGGINELNSAQFLYFTRKGLFTKDQYKNRFEHAIYIVTSNTKIRNQFKNVKPNNEQTNAGKNRNVTPASL